MALISPPKISDQLKAIKQYLQEQLTEAAPGSVAAICSNLKDMWKQAFQASDRFKVLIVWKGDTVRGPFSQANCWVRVDRQWVVAVIHGRGYEAERGDSVPVLSDMVENVRDWLRSMLGLSEELPTIDLKGITQANQGNLILDGYLIEFSTANDIPMIFQQGATTPIVPNIGFPAYPNTP
jgi:hypothetical protein